MTLSQSPTPLGLSSLLVTQEDKHVDTPRLGLDTEVVITDSNAPTCPPPSWCSHSFHSFISLPTSSFLPKAGSMPDLELGVWGVVMGTWLLSGSLLSAHPLSHIFIHSSIPWLCRLHIHSFFLFFKAVVDSLLSSFPNSSVLQAFWKHHSTRGQD